MDEKLLSAYSVEDIRKILHGPRDEIVQTMKMSSHASGKRVDYLYKLTRGEVLDTIESISKDTELIELIIDDARKGTEDIKAGATTRGSPYPYIGQILAYFAANNPLQCAAFGSFVGSFAGSFVIQKFGNKEDL